MYSYRYKRRWSTDLNWSRIDSKFTDGLHSKRKQLLVNHLYHFGNFIRPSFYCHLLITWLRNILFGSINCPVRRYDRVTWNFPVRSLNRKWVPSRSMKKAPSSQGFIADFDNKMAVNLEPWSWIWSAFEDLLWRNDRQHWVLQRRECSELVVFWELSPLASQS